MAEGDAESAATPAPPADAGTATAAARANAISEEEVSALLEKSSTDAVRPYDLTAQRINRTQLPMLEVVSKSFAERMGTTLSGLLGRDAAAHFTALDSGKAGELQAALPVPASLAVLRLKPLPGFAFVSVEPGLLLTLLDGFFGGSGRAISDNSAAIAPAAQRFLALLLRSVAPDLTAAWTPVAPLELELVKQETNPRLMQLGAPADPMVVLKFTIEFAARSGRVDWFLPETLLAPIREALESTGGNSPAQQQESWAPLLGAYLQDAELETRAILAQAQISLRELVRLTPGDIIPIEPPQQVTLLAGDVPLYHGRFGVSQGRNALKILSGGPA
jgi:flagellar motor switch protein FliM